jgi:alanine racemase
MDEGDFATSRLTVRLDAMAANLRAFRQWAGSAEVAPVVKADGYGLGLKAIASALTGDTFFVARLAEGMALRPLKPDARIVVLDGLMPGAAPAFLSHRLTPALNSLAQLSDWQAAAQTARAPLDAVLHVDTGMNRLGLPPDELALLAAEARPRLQGLNLALVMSHLACADDPAHPLNATQLSRFRQALAMLPAAPASLAASAGVLLGPDYRFDLVRPGIGLYGANPGKGGKNPVQTVAVLEGRVLQVRRIDTGDSVGYAATFHAKRPTLLATVALGYADGVMRSTAATGMAAIAGKAVPFAGRISMDLAALDATGLDVKPGDWAELIGDTVTLDQVAAAAGTNAYEILTGLGARVPRFMRDRS